MRANRKNSTNYSKSRKRTLKTICIKIKTNNKNNNKLEIKVQVQNNLCVQQVDRWTDRLKIKLNIKNKTIYYKEHCVICIRHHFPHE